MSLEVMDSGELLKVPTQVSPGILERITTLEAELAALKQEVGLVKDTITSRYYALSGGTPIQANTDLNTITTIGNYYQPLSAAGATILNTPVKNAFTMKVELSTGSGYVCQTLRYFVDGSTYYRFKDGDNWREWKKVTA